MSGTIDLQPTYKRQRFLLSFISQLHGGVNSTDLQKLIFLHTMEGHSAHYEFIPYKYGAYSFQLAEDLDTLRRNGFLLSTSPIKSIKENNDEIQFIASERGRELIRKTYRQYPYYAINSEIIDQLFNEEETKNFYKNKDNYSHSALETPTLFTIGYEGRSIENFINTLIQNNVRMLVDVRKNPISRKFGFSKNKLKHITETSGIKYIHIPALGIESEKRAFLETPNDYRQLFIGYKNSLNTLERPLNYLYALFSASRRIALVCFEREAKMCHRHVIRDYLVRIYNIRSKDL